MPTAVASAMEPPTTADHTRRGRTRRECSRDRASHASMSAVVAALASTGRASASTTHRTHRAIRRAPPRGDRTTRRSRYIGARTVWKAVRWA
ncbi:hypothetical protein LUW77_14950 [Streptomyces radiopugnans]|nr:hypothetical protein LUW77_14950 [Streptomyces radiopugnans]